MLKARSPFSGKLRLPVGGTALEPIEMAIKFGTLGFLMEEIIHEWSLTELPIRPTAGHQVVVILPASI